MIKTSKNKGFTLIELAVVLTVSGVLIAAFGSMIAGYMRHASISETRERIEKVQIALNQYYSINGKYPCPASLTANARDDKYAVETSDDCETNADGTFRVNGYHGGGTRNDIRIGALPTHTLRLPDIDMVDGWQSKFLYAVTIGQTQRENFRQSGGSIAIIDSDDNPVQLPVGTAHYVVISHGEDTSGGYSIHGKQRRECRTTSTLDGANCSHNSASFVSTIMTNSNASDSNKYDDILVFGAQTKPDDVTDEELMPAGAVAAFNLHNCPSGWQAVPETAGRTIIGAGDYTAGNADDTSYTYNRGDTGGLAMLKLSIEQMAPHFHMIRASGAAQRGEIETGGGPAIHLPAPYMGPPPNPPPPVSYTVAPVGNNVPHENRQPFMALLYCKKI